jgi:hypothetical protein
VGKELKMQSQSKPESPGNRWTILAAK